MNGECGRRSVETTHVVYTHSGEVTVTRSAAHSARHRPSSVDSMDLLFVQVDEAARIHSDAVALSFVRPPRPWNQEYRVNITVGKKTIYEGRFTYNRQNCTKRTCTYSGSRDRKQSRKKKKKNT